LGASIPEAYGGEGLDQISSTILAEKSGRYGSFATTFGAHTGIGTLPIVYFGNEQQKAKYLPKLASAEVDCGVRSDRSGVGLGCAQRQDQAVLSPDGKHYILNGTKMFITNAAFAHVFITFAKVDGEKFTGFIVERDFCRSINRAGRAQDGHSRLLDADVDSGERDSAGGERAWRDWQRSQDCVQRSQFRTLSSWVPAWLPASGMLRTKRSTTRKVVSNLASRLSNLEPSNTNLRRWRYRFLCAESMVYRTVGMIDTAMRSIDKTSRSAAAETLKALEDYVVECSIIKVANSEILDFVVDEAVQIYGGYGYSQDYPVERSYRDARINRIFEGTNEINRLLITGQLLKRAMKGQLGLITAAQKLLGELLSFPFNGGGG
jgi:alkylation response protein AidB-like acyl-CoA dehydrogenase